MRNIKLIIQYKGTNFHGFQFQKGVRTVQGEVEKAIFKMTREPIKINGASRTDAGVHALHMVLNFKTKSQIPPRGFLLGLNTLLPEDVAVKKVEEVPLDFDARKHALAKIYEYKILNSQVRNPLLSEFSWHVHRPINMLKMKKGASYLVGTHDFSAFRAAHCDSITPIRDVYSVQVEKTDDLIIMTICANAFLRNMVRIIVGTLVEVGLGRFEPSYIKLLLDSLKDRKKAGITAPPQGLYLKKIFYKKEDLFNYLGKEVRIYKEQAGGKL